MSSVPPLAPEEFILRRVPPHFDIMTLADGSHRPPSNAMMPRKLRDGSVETALSCSRLLLTTPAELLSQLQLMEPSIDSTGWKVCYLRVSDVNGIRDGDNGYLSVVTDPRYDIPVDLGHCGIYGANQQPCPRTKIAAKKLAAIARILTDKQVCSMPRGLSVY